MEQLLSWEESDYDSSAWKGDRGEDMTKLQTPNKQRGECKWQKIVCCLFNAKPKASEQAPLCSKQTNETAASLNA